MWFSAKTLYKYMICDRTQDLSVNETEDSHLFEERVVVVKADDFSAAEKKIEAEAKRYENKKWFNENNKEVKKLYLEVYDIFKIGETIEDETEVFSMMTTFERKTSNAEFENMRLGYQVPENIRLQIKQKFAPKP